MKSPVIVVSGLPRSGTSMLMKMLEAGGVDLLVDQARKPDVDNPKGYFEDERVKSLKTNASWIEDAEGKALKIVSTLLYYLPITWQYRIIFMQRDMRQVIASQNKMLRRLGQDQSGSDDRILEMKFNAHIERVKNWIKIQKNMRCLYVDYSNAIKNPMSNAVRIKEFLGTRLDVDAMASIVDPNLYRNR